MEDRTRFGQPLATVIEPRTRVGGAIAGALLDVYHRVGANTCTAYLLTEDRRELAASMVVDSPLSFGIANCFDVDDLLWPTSRSYQSGKITVFDEAGMWEGARRTPLPAPINIPFPMSVASVPIRTPRNRFGTIGIRWVPPRPVAPESREYLQAVADRLAAELEGLAGSAEAVTAPVVPVFIPAEPVSVAAPGDSQLRKRLQEAVACATTRGSHLYQLQRLATELTGAVRASDILSIAQARVVRAFGGRAAAFSLVEKERLHVVGAAGLPREAVQAIEGTPLSRLTPETDTIRTGRVRILASAAEVEQAYPGIKAEFDQQARGYFPLLYGGSVVGCCTIEFAAAQRPLSAAETTLLALMVEQVAQSLGRARSHEIEHVLMRRIQRTLLPGSPPHIPEAVTTARYFPATEGVAVGGDWYDVLSLPDGRMGLVVGDVEGHNLDAAALMGQLRSAVRAYAAEGHDPAIVLERSNRLLLGLDIGLFTTCCCVWVDVATGAATIASAGHPGPLVGYHHEVLRPELVVGPPLGVDVWATYRDTAVELLPGSVTALFTDGLLDTRQVGYDAAVRQLAGLLSDKSGEDLERLADAMAGGDRSQEARGDDATLVLMRYEGVPPCDQVRVARMSVQRHDLHGVADARRFLEDVLRGWDLLPVLDDLEILVSEVATNALIHAHSEVDFRLRTYPDHIRVEVRDSDPYPPVPTTLLDDDTHNGEAESGRGLLIVEALASVWGSSPAGRGKTTWFEIDTTEDPHG
ncbi:ATP-binding SpoIIE family protein phosphatase [Actinacidiphila acididurans]|uniref:SpoIIE family protein phosphatase n=1 Tax=Actinacidiphila acididurans TaxID=2784346 RepID=A0ABS2TKY9_9ACTN|nr:SpoIIE family protein phosphatase [Actinacidiphila acididurans]MBM9503171.1 SpoIIE family protein phosphatase [Actinacidiphila acididurans]